MGIKGMKVANSGQFKKGEHRSPLTEFKKGQLAWNNKGKNCDGYIKVITIDGRRIRKHRYVMEQYLGRKLHESEIVHHRNEDRKDNRIENLEILSRAEHNRIHVIPSRRRRKMISGILYG